MNYADDMEVIFIDGLIQMSDSDALKVINSVESHTVRCFDIHQIVRTHHLKASRLSIDKAETQLWSVQICYISEGICQSHSRLKLYYHVFCIV